MAFRPRKRAAVAGAKTSASGNHNREKALRLCRLQGWHDHITYKMTPRPRQREARCSHTRPSSMPAMTFTGREGYKSGSVVADMITSDEKILSSRTSEKKDGNLCF